MKGFDDCSHTAFDTIGNWLVAGACDGAVNVVDLATGSINMKVKHSSGSADNYNGITNVKCLQSSVNNSLAFSGCSHGIVKVWELNNNFAEHGNTGVDTVSENSPTNASDNTNGQSLWGMGIKFRMKQSLAVIKSHSTAVSAMIADNYDGDPMSSANSNGSGWLLVSGDTKGDIAITTGREYSSTTNISSCSARSAAGFVSLPNYRGQQNANTSSGNDNFAISSFSLACTGVTIPRIKTLDKKGKLTKSSAPPANVDLGTLIAGCYNGVVSVFDLYTAQCQYYLPDAHKAQVTKILNLRNKEFLTCSLDRNIKLWDIRTKNKTGVSTLTQKTVERSLGRENYYKCSNSPITAMTVGGLDNSLVISTSADGFIKIWDLRFDLNSPCSIIRGHSNRISTIQWNGRTDFHTASHDGTVKSWDSINGQCNNILPMFDSDHGIIGTSMSTFPSGISADENGIGSLLFRNCVVGSSWNGVIRAYYHDSNSF